MRIRLDLRYDGTAFFGWAKQPDKRTVQGELELALSKVLPGYWGKPVPTIVAGRTDTGVHANHQVVHFDYCFDNENNLSSAPTSSLNKASIDALTLQPADPQVELAVNLAADFASLKLLYRLSCVLPEDIVVYSATPVEDDFSARFWAQSRTYKYRICDNVQYLDPIRRHNVLYYKHTLDVTRMNKAVRGFTGIHDFAAFVKPRAGATSVRNLQKFNFRRIKSGRDRGLIVATLKADAFAYNMVRSLISASLLVGCSKRDVDWMRQCLVGGVREGATGPALALGLTLEHIKYPKNAVAARKREQQIKARRTTETN